MARYFCSMVSRPAIKVGYNFLWCLPLLVFQPWQTDKNVPYRYVVAEITFKTQDIEQGRWLGMVYMTMEDYEKKEEPYKGRGQLRYELTLRVNVRSASPHLIESNHRIASHRIQSNQIE